MKKPVVIHPILVAIFPTLFLYAHNVKEMPANQILVPIAVSLGLALVLWLLFGLLFKNKAKAGLATTVVLFSFSTYGHFYGLLGRQDTSVIRHEYLLSAALVAFGVGAYFIRRARGDFGTVTRVFNVAAAVIVAINAFTIVSYKVNMAKAPLPQQATSEYAVTWAADLSPETSSKVVSTPPSDLSELSTLASGESNPSPSPVESNVPSYPASEAAAREKTQTRPDIYLIVLDEYADPETMERLYGYDNSQFVTNLEEMGFFVARNSKMHNYLTARAVASILNMEYTDEGEPLEVTSYRIAHNRVVNHLHSLGYKYVYFGQLYELCKEPPADLYINYYETLNHEPVSFEFSKILWKTTMLSPLQESVARNYDAQYLRESFLLTLDRLGQVSALEGPKFVYAHIMAAHTPYVFGPDGEDVSGDATEKQAYFGQYVFTTKIIEEVVEQLLANSTHDPIIVVQSDHGPRWSGDWKDILNAYHLPGDGRGLLYDNISPVNTFRIILNHYLDGSYALLEDK